MLGSRSKVEMSQLLSGPTEPRIQVELTGVPETLLWNLYFRVSEASRPDTILPDPVGVDLFKSLDYPFAQRFGRAHPLQAQAQALRCLAFDREVQHYLSSYPDATVVSLGEGLETQAWRVDNGQVRWLTVELSETARLRRALLPDSPRRRVVVGSAFDEAWIDRVDPTHAVLITAQGLLMYFQRAEVHELIERCAAAFPEATMLFDAVPRWFSNQTQKVTLVNDPDFRPPPMPWGLDGSELDTLRDLTNIAELKEIDLPQGRGMVFKHLMPVIRETPSLRRSRLTILAPWVILRARFGSSASSFAPDPGPLGPSRTSSV